MDKESWLSDPRYATNEARQENWDMLFQEIEAWTSRQTAKACEATLTAAGVPCSAYRSVADLIADPHFIERGSFQSVTDVAGELLVPNLPFRLSGGDVAVRSPVPDLGEHTRSVLETELNLSPHQIDELRIAGALG